LSELPSSSTDTLKNRKKQRSHLAVGFNILNFSPMNNSTKPILYIKSGCPWCDEALSYFKSNNVQVETREVRRNKVFMEQMVKLSSQSKTPTFVLGTFMVADFDIGEFQTALNQAPAVKAQLGL
jgi:glutaredoxin 3